MLSRLILNKMQTEDPAQYRKRVGILGSCINMLFNLLLSLAKFLVGIFSGSVAVTADAVNNLSDCSASLVTLLGFLLAAKKPDKKHPFGYGRVEYLSGSVVALLILLFSIELARSSFDRILHPTELQFSWWLLLTLLIAALAKLWMWRINLVLGKAVGGSETMEATAFDSLSDVAATLVSMASLLIGKFTSFPVDGYLGLLISVMIFVGGIKILLDTIRPLLGQPADKETADEIKSLALSYPEIIGVHDLMLHGYGPSLTLATLHAEVPADNDILYAHEVIDRAEREISEKTGVTLLIHLDPVVMDDKRVQEVKKQVDSCLENIDERLTMHDFRMVEGKTRINLIFDVLVPYEIKTPDEQIKLEIEEKLQNVDSRYHCVITLDRSFVQ